jgi:hypothetical protein
LVKNKQTQHINPRILISKFKDQKNVMKKIAMFSLLATLIVVAITSCNEPPSVSIERVKVVGLDFSPFTFDSLGWCQCKAVLPNGDTVPTLVTAAHYYGHKIPMLGTLEICGDSKFFFAYNGHDYVPAKIKFPSKDKELLSRGTKKWISYLCYAYVPNGDSLKVSIPESVYLGHRLPIDGYVYISGNYAKVTTFSIEKMRHWE